MRNTPLHYGHYRHYNQKVKKSQGRSAKDKTTVFGIIERNGRVITFVVPNAKAKTLQTILKDNVHPNATLITDAWKGYKGMDKKVKQHITIKHKDYNFVTFGDKHTNNIEGFWGNYKPSIAATYRQVSPKYISIYFDEFSFFHNRRKANLFSKIMNIFSKINQKITYKQLTERTHPKTNKSGKASKRADK